MDVLWGESSESSDKLNKPLSPGIQDLFADPNAATPPEMVKQHQAMTSVDGVASIEQDRTKEEEAQSFFMAPRAKHARKATGTNLYANDTHRAKPTGHQRKMSKHYRHQQSFSGVWNFNAESATATPSLGALPESSQKQPLKSRQKSFGGLNGIFEDLASDTPIPENENY